MATQQKIDTVAEIKARLEACEIAVASQYVGISVEKVTELRKKLREAGVEMKVYKNTLTKRAFAELGITGADGFMQGPTAWAFAKDPVTPAKILKDFAAEVKFVSMSGAVLNGRAVSKEGVEALASLPPRDVLLAQVVGTIAAPLRNLVGALNGVPRNLVNVIDQIRKQKEEGAAAA